MSKGKQVQMEQLPTDLEAIAASIRGAAEQRRGNGLALLMLLRLLEALHHEVQEGLLQECLPDNRQALYAMLKDMEAKGGWPYIPRMRLRSLINQLMHEFRGQDNASEHEDSLNR